MPIPVIDIHIHLACIGDSGQGGKLSHKMRYSPQFWGMLLLHRLLPWEVDDSHLHQKVIHAIQASQRLDFGVVLALDAVYTGDGQPDWTATHLYTPNQVVCQLAQTHRKILFGASVHPNRPDWAEELESCKSKGAVLVKWLPSSQQIDPAAARYRPFYQKLVALGLPLLSHTSVEHTVPSHGFQHYNDPARLELPLSEGVTVIAAHSCLPAFAWDQDYFPAFMQLWERAEKQGWKLFADVSAFGLPGRRGQVPRVRKYLSSDRLILGSDFPIPILPFSYREKPIVNPAKNHLDRNIQALQAMGFPDQVLTNASHILTLPAGKLGAVKK